MYFHGLYPWKRENERKTGTGSVFSFEKVSRPIIEPISSSHGLRPNHGNHATSASLGRWRPKRSEAAHTAGLSGTAPHCRASHAERTPRGHAPDDGAGARALASHD